MLAASIESFFIFLLIAAASAFFNWIKKKGEKAEDWTEAEKRNPTTPVPRERTRRVSQPAQKTTNWEEELRRILENATPKTPPQRPPPMVLPEIKLPPQRAPSFPPLEPVSPATMSVPKIFTEEKFYKAHCNYCDGHIEFPASAMEQVIACPHCQRSTVLRPFEQTPVEVLAHRNVMADFTASDRKYEEASQLSQRVAAHMHGVGHQAVGTTSAERRKRTTPSIDLSLAQFRNAKTIRQAMIASFILGPPKALEN
ncbi:MAG: hypothetical protein ABJC04_08635 [Verrucomicrobiota bacterium]